MKKSDSRNKVTASDVGAKANRYSDITPLFEASVFLFFLMFFAYQLCTTFFLSYDSGLISIGSDLLVRGGHLYKDLHTVMFPGSYFVLATAFLLFGSSQLVCNITALVSIFGVSVLLLLLSTRFLKGYEVYLPTALVVVFGVMVCPFVNHHWDSLFWLLAFVNSIIYMSTRKDVSKLLAILTGIFAGLSIVCYQNQILPVVAGLVALFVNMWKNKTPVSLSIRLISCITAGLLAVMSILLAYLVLTDSIFDMYESTISFVIQRYHSVNGVDYGFSVFESSFIGDREFPLSIFSALPFGLLKVAPILVVCGIIFVIGKFARRNYFANLKPQIFILFIVAIFLFGSEMHKPDLKRLVFGEPLLLICLIYMADGIRYKSARILISGFYLCLAVGIIVNAQTAIGSFSDVAKVYQTRRGQIRSCVDLSVLKKLDEITTPYEKVLIYPYDTGLSYLSQTVFPGRFPTLQYRYHSRKNFEDVISDMESSKVRFVVFNRAMNNQNFSITGFPRYKQLATNELILEPYLKEKYQPIGTYGIYSVFKRVGQ